jgi:hypothetical protein
MTEEEFNKKKTELASQKDIQLIEIASNKFITKLFS